MIKTNYDDLSNMPEGGQKPKRKLSNAFIAVICLLTVIIIAVAILIIYNMLSKVEAPQAAASAPAVEQTVDETAPAATADTEPEIPAPAAPVVPDFSQVSTAQSLGNAAKPSYEDQVQYQEYTLGKGETLETVASKFGITIQTILSVNQIKNPSAVVEGTKITVPDRSGRLYTVEEGDMLSSITKKSNLSMGWKTLQEVNGLKGESIFVGQKLFIPDETAVESISFAASGIEFKSPLKGGTMIAYYGQSQLNPSTKTTEILNGILIAGSEGAAVTAASSGTVMDTAYDATGSQGYYVKISHDGGYNSYYCFLDMNSIKVGVSDKVDIGDEIGSISSGSSPYGSPTLYFKIEQNGIMLDPSVFF
jgi:lipoprotein NlpD